MYHCCIICCTPYPEHAQTLQPNARKPGSKVSPKVMALALFLLEVTAHFTSLVTAAVPLSSTADVDLRNLASAISTAREGARHLDDNDSPQQPPRRLRLHHLEAMWHTSLGKEVSYNTLGLQITQSTACICWQKECWVC